jgi:PIN domain nuclease of toxin-antitoxin system
MEHLLDSHTLIWAATDVTRLSKRASAVIANEQNKLCVSAASAWEIATKVRIGKLPEAILLESDFERIVQQAGYRLLAIDIDVALRAGRLPLDHKDPFDRMIAAQALGLDIPVISADPKLDLFGVRRIW